MRLLNVLDFPDMKFSLHFLVRAAGRKAPALEPHAAAGPLVGHAGRRGGRAAAWDARGPRVPLGLFRHDARAHVQLR